MFANVYVGRLPIEVDLDSAPVLPSLMEDDGEEIPPPIPPQMFDRSECV